MIILVTGATGFVGNILCERLLAESHRVLGTLLPTEDPNILFPGVEPVKIDPLGPQSNWQSALNNIDTVIHLAARVHVMNDSAVDPLAEYREVNVAGTVRLAKEAARLGVKRLVFISSIKVNGEESATPYTEESPVHPTDPYGISKWEAEHALRQVEAESGLQVVVIRRTLVYGPGVKGNFRNMMKVVQRGTLLPLASIENKRSLIYVGNLVDALATCATHPTAAGQTYLVSDGEDVSTPELIRKTARELGVPARLIPFSLTLMRLAGHVTGKKAAVDRLTGSLTVNDSKIRKELGWKPPYTMEEGLKATAEWYKRTNQ